MKHLFTFFLILLCFTGFSQRTADLDVKILSPSSPFAIEANETFNLQILISNLGTSSITEDDSLFFYMIISGDTVQFPPQGNYEIYQEAIASGSSYTLTRPMAFNSSFDGTAVSFCVAFYPKNSASPISDPVGTNNKSCIQVEIGEQPTTGISDKGLVSVSLFPNPVSDMLKIQSDETIENIQISDPEGKIIYSGTDGNKTVDVSGLSNGIYYVLVETATGKGIEKFVVQRD